MPLLQIYIISIVFLVFLSCVRINETFISCSTYSKYIKSELISNF